jgi:hypothetical protein
MIYSAELASVNLRVYLYAFKFGPDPYEECAVDLTNLYGPDCVLRKHGILPRNFAWGEPEPTTDPSERHANDVLTFIRRIFERAAERAVILQSD